MNRIQKLRINALESEISYDEFFYKFYKSYGNAEQVNYEHYAQAFKFAFSNLTPVISDGELIVGKCSPLPPNEYEEWHDTYKEIMSDIVDKSMVGQDSHMAVDYELVLKLGLNGIIKKIDDYLQDCQEDKKTILQCLQRLP